MILDYYGNVFSIIHIKLYITKWHLNSFLVFYSHIVIENYLILLQGNYDKDYYYFNKIVCVSVQVQIGTNIMKI